MKGWMLRASQKLLQIMMLYKLLMELLSTGFTVTCTGPTLALIKSWYQLWMAQRAVL